VSHPLPVPELTRRLRLHKAQRGDLAAIAAMAEIDAQYLKRVVREGKYSMRMADTLSRILDKIEHNELRWKKNTPKIAKRDGHTDPELINKTIIETRPVGAPQTQRRIVKACDYSEWARCNACGGLRFSAIYRHTWFFEKPRYYACNSCVDTPERIMMGQAAATEQSPSADQTAADQPNPPQPPPTQTVHKR
jgi:hypothetical protein